MKTIGLVGGITWQATASYYELINRSVQDRLGRLHSAKVLIHSLDFEEIVEHQRRGEWRIWEEKLTASALLLERAGADLVLLCCNTAHKAAGVIQQALSIPLVHIADTAGKQITRAGFQTVALLGTRVTMEEGFYRDRMNTRFGLTVHTPGHLERDFIDRTIFDELGKGVFKEDTKKRYLEIIADLVDTGAQAIVLGCTEICLLIREGEVDVPLFDTLSLHAEHAVAMACSSSEN